MRLLIVMLSIILFSCSPGKRLNRFIKRNPEFIRVDTIYVRDTIVTAHYSKDTIVSLQKFIESRDTIILSKEKLIVKIFHSGDSLGVRGECQSDTIYIEKKIPVEKIKVEEKKEIPFLIWVVILGLLLILFFKK